MCGITFFIEAFKVGNSVIVHYSGTVGNGLSGDVHQVIFKVVITAIFVCHAHHQPCGFCCGSGIVIVAHFAPAGCLEIIQRWTPTKDTFVRTLLVVACRTVIDTVCQDLPSLPDRFIVCAIACADVLFDPFFFGKLFCTPRKFAHQFEHNGIIFNAFHRQTDAF